MNDSRAPIVVGAMTDRMSDRIAPIVVGVDDTSAARGALRFALREAGRRGSAVDVVTAWTWHNLGDAPEPPGAREWARAQAQEIQDAAVADVLGDLELLPVLSRQVVEGNAAEVLLRLSRAADYLVVGSGHKGQMRRILLGSVSEYCVRHASCPVLVVPASAAESQNEELLVAAHE